MITIHCVPLGCSSKGVSDLKARLNYSYHNTRSCENLNLVFLPKQNVYLVETFLEGCWIFLSSMYVI